jgi:hypothetical protein
MEPPPIALPPPVAREFVPPGLEPPVAQRQFAQEFAGDFSAEVQESSESALPCWLLVEPLGLAVGLLGVVILGLVAFRYARPAKPVLAAA